MPLTHGQMVYNRYRIVRLLGQGGFGAVYLAWDVNLERRCALKENLDTSAGMRRQFEREARLLANLNHPNLPRVTDHFFIPDQGQYLVMDFVEGDDLAARLQGSAGPLPVDQALGWTLQVADALAYLHGQDPPVIHRDIKPANIRISPQGKATLVDFGIAKVYDPGTRTTVGARAVTPGFSPPEQYGRGATDERSDVYALGATLYALLTARTPPDGVDLLTGSAQPPPPADRLNGRVPPGVGRALMRAMAPAREGRFPTIAAFAAELRSAASGAGLIIGGAYTPGSYTPPGGAYTPGGTYVAGSGSTPREAGHPGGFAPGGASTPPSGPARGSGTAPGEQRRETPSPFEEPAPANWSAQDLAGSGADLAGSGADLAGSGSPPLYVQPGQGAYTSGGQFVGPSGGAYPPPSVVLPVGSSASRPRPRSSTRLLAYMAVAGLAAAVIGLAWAVYALSRPDGRDTATPPAALTSAAQTAAAVLPSLEPPTAGPTDPSTGAPPTDAPPTDAPTGAPPTDPPPTDPPTAPPTDPAPPTPIGAVAASLPDAFIAYVSDGGGASDGIVTQRVRGGEHLFTGAGADGLSEWFSASPRPADGSKGEIPFGARMQLPRSPGYDIAWWPEWCIQNKLLLFEAQNSADPKFQTIYSIGFDAYGEIPGAVGAPEAITWEGAAKIGVPRCATRADRAVASALADLSTNAWRLHTFQPSDPTHPQIIGDGFPFSGFASWGGDDNWIAFMHTESGQPFNLFWMSWGSPGVFSRLETPDTLTTARYPALSPVASRIAYACPQNNRWALCLQDVDGGGFSAPLKNLAPMESGKRGVLPAVPAVSPSWSPDGRWLAYSSSKDGDWDVYLFYPQLGIEINLTGDLPGNQFEPAWSKP